MNRFGYGFLVGCFYAAGFFILRDPKQGLWILLPYAIIAALIVSGMPDDIKWGFRKKLRKKEVAP